MVRRVAVFPEQRGDDQQRNHGKRNQQADFPFGRRIRKNAKRRARIFGVDDAKKSGNDRNAVVQGKPARDHPLGDAIESDDEQRDQEMIFTHGMEFCSIFCHPERSEGSAVRGKMQILRFAQDDNS